MTFKMSDYVSAPVGGPAGCFDTTQMKVLSSGGGEGGKKIFNDFMTVKEGDLTFMVPNSSLDADPALRDSYFGRQSEKIITIGFQWGREEGEKHNMMQSGSSSTVKLLQIRVQVINPCQLSSSFMQSAVGTAIHILRDTLNSYEWTDFGSTSSLTHICGPIISDNSFTEVVDTFNAGIVIEGSPEVGDTSIIVKTKALAELTLSNKGQTYSINIYAKFLNHPAPFPEALVHSAVVTFITGTCERPAALTPSVIDDDDQKLSYTITEQEFQFTFASFTTDPPDCLVTQMVKIIPELPDYSPVQTLSPYELKAYQVESLEGLGTHKIQIEASTGTDEIVKKTISYELQILDPCLDTNFVDISLPSQTDNIAYPVTKGTSIAPIQFNIGLFQPIGVHHLCGTLNIEVKMDQTIITDTTQPVAYDITTGMLMVYSSDLSLIEIQKEIKFEAFFGNYREQIKKQMTINLNFLDPCKDKELASLTGHHSQPVLLDPYYYDGTQFVYELNELEVLPEFCIVAYKCSMDEDSPRLDLCSVTEGTLLAEFETMTRTFTVSVSNEDRESVPPGSYKFIITASIGDGTVSVDQRFTLQLIDPCSVSSMVSLTWSNQVNIDDDYYYGSEDRLYQLTQPVVLPQFCKLIYTCILDPNSPRTDLCDIVESDLYGVFDPETLSYGYRIKNPSHAPGGDYKFVITATVLKTIAINQSSPRIKAQTSFKLTFVEPCFSSTAHIILREQTSPDTYIYGDGQLNYNLVAPETEPPGCNLSYVCTVREGPRTDLCSALQVPVFASKFYDFNQKFVFMATDKDVVPPGDYIFDINVNIIGGTAPTIKTTFILTLWDPCSAAKLQLYPDLLFPNLTYFYFDPEPVSFPYQYQTLAFYTVPQNYDCGEFRIKFEDAQTSKSLETEIFDDGLADTDTDTDTSLFYFKVLPTVERKYLQNQIKIRYTVSLINQPSNSVSNIFYVSIRVRDECDQRLLEVGIFDDEPEQCKPGVSSPRPVKEPRWFGKLQNQVIERGQQDLFYYLGEPVNVYGEPMSVFVDFGDLSNATYYESGINEIIVDQARLPLNDTGYQQIEIRANYVEEITGEKVWFTKTIYLLITEPPVVFFIPSPQKVAPINPSLPLDIFQDIQKIDTQEVIKQAQSKGPVPFVKSFSWSGELRIGWTRPIKQYEKVEILQTEKIAVQIEVYEEYKKTQEKNDIRNGRRLSILPEDELIQSNGFTFKLTDSIEIVNEGDQGGNTSWSIVYMNSEELVLQVNTESQQQFQSFEQEFTLIFWNTKYFADKDEQKMPFGSSITWKSFRLAQPYEIERFEQIEKVAIPFFYVLGLFAVINLLTCGPLLPFWMFLNSLQLFAHLVLLNARIPALSNLVMTKLLDLTRLRLGLLPQILYLFQVSETSARHELLEYELFVACGFTASLSHNVAPILILLATGAAISIILCFKDLLCCGISRKRHKAYGFNLMIRILYECFFEIALCLLISHVIADRTKSYKLKLCLLVLAALLPAFMCLLSYRFGPYINNSYEPCSLAKSFWAFRPLRQEHLLAVNQKSKNKKNLDKRVAVRNQNGEKEVQKLKNPITCNDRSASSEARSKSNESSQRIEKRSKSVNSIDRSILGNDKIQVVLITPHDYQGSQSATKKNQLSAQEPGDEYFSNSLPMITRNKPLGQFAEIRSDSDRSVKVASFSDEKLPENLDQELEGGETEVEITKYGIGATGREQLKLQAKARIRLELKTLVNQNFSTLFTGLKRNTEHNVAVIYPFIFLIRRMIYSSVLVYFFSRPLLAALGLLIQTMVIISYLLTELPWQSTMVNNQQILTEIGLYFCILVFSYLSTELPEYHENDIILSIFAAICLLNILVIAIKTVIYLRQVCKRLTHTCKARKRRKLKLSNKVASITLKQKSLVENQQVEEDKVSEVEPTQRGLIENRNCPIQISEERDESVFNQEVRQELCQVQEEKVSHQIILNSVGAHAQKDKGLEFLDAVKSGREKHEIIEAEKLAIRQKLSMSAEDQLEMRNQMTDLMQASIVNYNDLLHETNSDKYNQDNNLQELLVRRHETNASKLAAKQEEIKDQFENVNIQQILDQQRASYDDEVWLVDEKIAAVANAENQTLTASGTSKDLKLRLREDYIEGDNTTQSVQYIENPSIDLTATNPQFDHDELTDNDDKLDGDHFSKTLYFNNFYAAFTPSQQISRQQAIESDLIAITSWAQRSREGQELKEEVTVQSSYDQQKNKQEDEQVVLRRASILIDEQFQDLIKNSCSEPEKESISIEGGEAYGEFVTIDEKSEKVEVEHPLDSFHEMAHENEHPQSELEILQQMSQQIETNQGTLNFHMKDSVVQDDALQEDNLAGTMEGFGARKLFKTSALSSQVFGDQTIHSSMPIKIEEDEQLEDVSVKSQ